MAALTADRNTPQRPAQRREPPVKGSTKIYAGAMTAIDTTGNAVPAGATATLKVIGRASQQVDNSAGADGDLRVPVDAGVFRFDNSSSTDALTLADVGASCYAVDDHTVAKTSNSSARPVAGTVFDVDALGVWVKFS